MPRARITMKRIRTIIELHSRDRLSQRMIARAVGVSRPVVGHYISLFIRSGLSLSQVEATSDTELDARLRPSDTATDPRYEEFARLLPGITRELGRHGVTRQLLWEEYRRTHRNGYSYTQFCFYLQAYAETSEISMHLEHEGGRKIFLDFAGWKPKYFDNGVERAAELFVAVFPASDLIYCEGTESQAVEQLVCATRHALEYAGGAPAILVPDNLKAGVTASDRYEPKVNETFEDFATYYGSVVIPARVRRPKDKALVEQAVNIVYRRVLAPLRDRRFSSLDELNEAIAEKLEQVNERPMQRIGISRWERFRSVELPALKPLPDKPYQIRKFHALTVGFNYHVYFSPDKHYYSVPWTLRRKKVQVVSNATTVEIYYNHQRVSTHRRDYRAGQYSTHREHMPENHRVYAEWTPERFLRWAEKYGSHTQELISSVLSSRSVPEQSYRSCMGILNLGKDYGAARLEAAAARAVTYGIANYRAVKSILQKGLDRQPTQKAELVALPEHENIRGGTYYQLRGTGETR